PAAWWPWTTLLVCSLSALPLAPASMAVWRAGQHEAEPAGSAGDVFDDLAPVFRWKPVRRLELPEHPWRFALLSAVAVFAVGVAGGGLSGGGAGPGRRRALVRAGR